MRTFGGWRYASAILGLVCYKPNGIWADDNAHIGSVVEATVGIEVTNRAGDGAASRIRRGLGVIIRCDGYILAPFDLFDRNVVVAGQTERAETQSISVILHPGTDNEQKFSASQPFVPTREPLLTVIKAKAFHAPAAKSLLPDSLLDDAEIQTVGLDWNASARRFSVSEPLNCAVVASVDKNVLAFKEPVLSTKGPVYTKSGYLIGFIVEVADSRAKSFVTLTKLGTLTNCIAPSAIPDGAISPAQAIGKQVDRMLKLGGGKFKVSQSVLSIQPDLGNNMEVCIAPFEMDKFKVTNRQYYDFWLTIPASDRKKLTTTNRMFPQSWDKSGEPFPAELENYPVLNVPLPGAEAYAKWQGKRLPTPFEWSKAAFGEDGDKSVPAWIQELGTDRVAVWQKCIQMHEDFAIQNRLTQTAQDGTDYSKIPWVARGPASEAAARWSKQTVEQITDSFASKWKEPLLIVPFGYHDYDVSTSGIADIFMNGAEMVLPYPGNPVRGNPVFMQARWSGTKGAVINNRLINGNIHSEIVWSSPSFPYVPLSRLFRRTVTSPENIDLLAASALEDVQALMLPLGSFQFEATMESSTTAIAPQRLPGTPSALRRPYGLHMWVGLPRHFHREMGMAVPLQGHETHFTTSPGLHYLLPNGFRCVR